ncbi:MAG: hypothetical protein II940_03910 [Methanosarcinaceae archaeon]|nr:hypothetical protein [Methanosarcinaceae archaeon]
MRFNVILALCLCFLIGGITAASASNIGFNYPAMPDNGFPVGVAVSVPVEISGAENLGFVKATISDVSGGAATIEESNFGNTKVSDNSDVFVWYGNYTGGLNGTFNSSGYSNNGTATLFYLNVTPDGSQETVDVTLTFNEIWTTNLVNGTPDYLTGNSIRLSLQVDTVPSEMITVSYSAGDISAYVPDSEEIAAGSSYTISEYRGIADDTYIFDNWMMGNGIYAPGDTVTLNADSEFAARWIAIDFEPGLSDVVLVNNYIIGTVTDIDQKYDITGDGEIDIFDLVYLAQFVADH